jgi:predicted RecA/RadA family phage recombinase
MANYAKYVQDDDAVDYTPSSDVTAGQVVVQGDLIGVAKRPIPANTLGALTTEGIYDFPKATGGGSGIAAGTVVQPPVPRRHEADHARPQGGALRVG